MRVGRVAILLVAWFVGQAAFASSSVLTELTMEEPIHHCRWQLRIRDNGRVAFKRKNCTLTPRGFKSHVSKEAVTRIKEALQDVDFCGLRPEYLPDWPEKDKVVVVDAPRVSIAARCGSNWKIVHVEGAEFIAGLTGDLPENPDEDAARRFLRVWKSIVDAASRPASDGNRPQDRGRR